MENLNLTSNETTYCMGRNNTVDVSYGLAEIIIYSLLGAVLCIVSFVGNVLVIIVIIKDPSLSRHKQNLYLLSLAVSDALLAVLTMPFAIAAELMGSWVFGTAYCYIYLSLDITLITASICNIAFIGIDRFASVKFPILYRRYKTVGKIRSIIIGIWIYSVFVSVIPYFTPATLDSTKNENQCLPLDEPWYVILSNLLSFFIPALVICPVYIGIYVIGRRVSSGSSRKSISTERRSTVNQHKNENLQKANSQRLGSEFSVDSGVEIESKQKPVLTGAQRLGISIFRKQHKQEKYTKRHSIEEMDSGTGSRSNVEEYSMPSGTANNTLAPPKSKNYLETRRASENVSSVTGRESSGNSPAKKAENGQSSGAKKYFNLVRNTITFVRRSSVETTSMKRRNTNSSNASPQNFQKTIGPKGKRNSNARNRISSRERRFIFIIVLVTGCFLISWTPFFVTNVTLSFCLDCCIDVIMFRFFFFFGYVNSAVNPLIYTIFNKDFRMAFRRILKLTRNSS